MLLGEKLNAGGVIVLDGATAIEVARYGRVPGLLAASPASAPRPRNPSLPPPA